MRHILLLTSLLAASASAHPLPIPHGHEAVISTTAFWPAALGIATITALAILLTRKRSR